MPALNEALQWVRAGHGLRTGKEDWEVDGADYGGTSGSGQGAWTLSSRSEILDLNFIIFIAFF
jgi:hypothetical protein